jgi:hypothetical protein
MRTTTFTWDNCNRDISEGPHRLTLPEDQFIGSGSSKETITEPRPALLGLEMSRPAVAQPPSKIEAIELYETVSFRKNVTGVDHTLFFSPGPYVKVAVDPPDSLDPSSQTATITLAGTLVAGTIAPEILRQVLRFIKANRDTLLDYWDYRIDTDQLWQRLQRR